MDTKTLCAHVAKLAGCDPQQAASLLSAFADVVCQRAADLDSIAIPRFGNFVVSKHQEKIVTDPASGKRMLIPPQIKIEFTPSASLKVKLANK